MFGGHAQAPNVSTNSETASAGSRGAISIILKKTYTLPETNSKQKPLKMDGWNTSLSYWEALFSGAMLVSGRVILIWLVVFSHPFEKYAWQIGFIFPNFRGENSKNM